MLGHRGVAVVNQRQQPQMNTDKCGYSACRKATAAAFPLGIILLACSAVASAESSPSVVKPLVVFTGSDSKIDVKTVLQITSQKKLDELWAKHVGKTETDNRRCPEIDFDRCILVAAFQGATVNQLGNRVDETIESPDSITLRVNRISYQSAGESNVCTPYIFIALPKTTKTIIIEENSQSYLGQPPIWKETARLSEK